MIRSYPALTVGAAFEEALITIGMTMTASGVEGASAVLPALRAHVPIVYVPAVEGVHVKEAFVDHVCPTCVVMPFMTHHLNCTGAVPPVAMAENVMLVPVT